MSQRFELRVNEPRRLPGWLDRALSVALTPNDSLETARTKRLTAGVLWASIPVTLASASQLAFMSEAPIAAWTVASLIVTAVATLTILRARPSTYPNVVHLILCHAILTSAILSVMAGGLLASSVNAVWGFVAVVASLAVFGDRRATFWLWFFVASQVVASAWGAQIEPLYVIADPEITALFNLSVVAVFVYFMMYYYVRQRVLLLDQSDALLHNILPDAIARRLKTSNDLIADEFDSASVLFADVVEFTPMSAGMEPSELVGLLDEVFSEIDALVEERGLEKIKTIGDAYMVAAGVPEPRADHAQVLCDLALEIQNLCHSRTFKSRDITFRIGINTGPLVAGIIGTKKFSYDLWGDAVNTASRMESSGVAGSIQITESTHSLVENAFVCEPRGSVDVKGKGPMKVWSVVGRS